MTCCSCCCVTCILRNLIMLCGIELSVRGCVVSAFSTVLGVSCVGVSVCVDVSVVGVVGAVISGGVCKAGVEADLGIATEFAALSSGEALVVSDSPGLDCTTSHENAGSHHHLSFVQVVSHALCHSIYSSNVSSASSPSSGTKQTSCAWFVSTSAFLFLVLERLGP